MFNKSFQSAVLPPTLNQASISLILKKNKDPLACSSYRPISLLNVDFKLLSKTLALCLETMLPSIISPDQTGFIKNRHSFFNLQLALKHNLSSHYKSHSGGCDIFGCGEGLQPCGVEISILHSRKVWFWWKLCVIWRRNAKKVVNNATWGISTQEICLTQFTNKKDTGSIKNHGPETLNIEMEFILIK